MADHAQRYVSRGGRKLAAALHALDLSVEGVRALDAGAATGGFTDCLLRRGAREVIAVDVAYGQFAWELRNHPRVRVLERTNVRRLELEHVGDPVEFVVADLSFISLRKVRDALLGVSRRDGTLVLLVKPQFELPRSQVPHGGVVRDPDAWAEAMRLVVEGYRDGGCGLTGAAASPLPGPKGNREFFVALTRGGVPDAGDGPIKEALEGAP